MDLILIKSIIEKVPRLIKSIRLINHNHWIVETELDFFLDIVRFFKYNTFFQFFLIDITAVDYLNERERFNLVYQFISFIFNYRLTLKIKCNNLDLIPSLTVFYESANWLEREVWDLFGIYFSQHKDLRRILTDYGFQGFPFRKDFPLSGFLELIYLDEEKRVVYTYLELTQEYRFFDFITSWKNNV